MLMTGGVVTTGAQRRRQEHALLRLRGASARQILQLMADEALLIGVGGLALGIFLGEAASRVLLGTSVLAPDVIRATAAGALLGLLLAFLALLVATHDPLVAERMATVWQMRHGALTDGETPS
jgi:putative ABC transport system permease protein